MKREHSLENISDGNHTFKELYEHRNLLFIALAEELNDKGFYVWKSLRYEDGTPIEGDKFLMGIGLSGDQISYHMEESYLPYCGFAHYLECAPPYDGYTSDDVLFRLMNYYI